MGGDPGGARILFLKLDNLTNLTLRGGEVVFLTFLSDLFFFTNFWTNQSNQRSINFWNVSIFIFLGCLFKVKKYNLYTIKNENALFCHPKGLLLKKMIKKQSYNLNLKFGKTNKCLFELMLCFYKRFIFLNRCF